MKTKLLTAVSVLALSAISNANAADIIRHREVQTVFVKPLPTFTWSGFYIGADAGYKWGKQKATLGGTTGTPAVPFTYDVNDDVKGGAAGIFAGFNSSIDNGSVFGIETDMLWNKINGHHGYRKDGVDTTDIYNVGLTEKWSGATRLRVGFGSDRVLPYLAAGVAYTRLTAENTSYRQDISNPTGPTDPKYHVVSINNSDQTYVGWTAGAGIDYAATDNLFVRLEYRYSDYGKKDFAAGSPPANTTFNPIRVKYSTHDVRVGVAYKF